MAKDKRNKTGKIEKNKSAQEQPKPTEVPITSTIWQDERFQHLVSDPRFRGIPKVQRKVKIDKRFQGMFTDEKFKVKYTVDKYGRRVNKSNAEDLRKYYEINSSDSDADEEEDKLQEAPPAEVDDDDEAEEELERRKEEKAITRDDSDDSGESMPSEEEAGENDELASDGEEVPKTLRERLLDPDIDYARGEGRLITDSSSDEESSEEEDDPVLNIDHVWGELDQEAETTEESTHRLAVCNMDWDRIRAVDLMVLFSSFLPPGGSVLSVNIYPSAYGKERMREEDLHGPTELVGFGKDSKKKTNSDSESADEIVQEQDSDAEEGEEYHMEKLRQYQLNRLRYYYAVAEFDSVVTADRIYKECDGIEYESSATRVDLRFIPNDTSFDEDEPTDICTDLPDTNTYIPRQFTTTALQQAKVDLTWDETAVERKELGEKLASGKLDEVSDKDLRKMVAYSSEEEDGVDSVEGDEGENANGNEPDSNKDGEASTTKKSKRNKKEDIINKYKALLAEIDEKENQKKNKFEMEVSWSIEQNDEEIKEDLEREDDKKVPQLTPIEKVLQKRSEKNKQRKEERKKKKMLALGKDPDADDSADSDSIPDGINLNDPYFAEEFANGDFVDPKAKKREKLKKKGNTLDKQQAAEEERQAKELELLLDDDDVEEQGKQHFSLEKILKSEQETKSKRKRRKQLKKSKSAIAHETKFIDDNFQININDERFKAVYTSAKFNIDPTDSHFKKTKAMELLIQEKLKRRHGDESLKSGGNNTAPEVEVKRPKKQLENKLLVNSLKRKIQMKQQT